MSNDLERNEITAEMMSWPFAAGIKVSKHCDLRATGTSQTSPPDFRGIEVRLHAGGATPMDTLRLALKPEVINFQNSTRVSPNFEAKCKDALKNGVDRYLRPQAGPVNPLAGLTIDQKVAWAKRNGMTSDEAATVSEKLADLESEELEAAKVESDSTPTE